MHRPRRHAERLRRLVDRQAAEEAQLDDLRLAGILGGEPVEREVDGEHVGSGLARRHVDAVERDANHVRAAAAIGAAAARDVHQHPSHHLGRDAEEVLAVLPPDGVPSEQPQAQLVDERGRLQADGGPLAHQVAGRHPVQLFVDERQHALERIGVAGAPGAEEPGDLAELPTVWWVAHPRNAGQSSRACRGDAAARTDGRERAHREGDPMPIKAQDGRESRSHHWPPAAARGRCRFRRASSAFTQ